MARSNALLRGTAVPLIFANKFARSRVHDLQAVCVTSNVSIRANGMVQDFVPARARGREHETTWGMPRAAIGSARFGHIWASSTKSVLESNFRYFDEEILAKSGPCRPTCPTKATLHDCDGFGPIPIACADVGRCGPVSAESD